MSRMKKGLIIFYLLLISMGSLITGCKENPELFAGVYTEGDEEGFSVFEFNGKNGSLELVSGADAGPSPSNFCFSNKHGTIYA